MKSCDICGKEETYLTPLNDNYKTEDIKEICLDCHVEVNDQLSKLHEITFKTNEHWLKKFMVNLAKGFAGQKKEPRKTPPF